MKNKVISIIAGVLITANAVAAAAGWQTGLDDTVMYTIATLIVTIAGIVWNTWNNFNVTNAAKAGQQIIDEIKASNITIEDVESFIATFDAIREEQEE